ncbi:MAG: group 1 truncated hemoglobin [Proteobacteria bacterium]|jgi:hemoglobin|nr:group 1 truncated hemoglobin [Methylibium sp.]MCH8856924.1 group 1 truncated hemoglobin [Pseudomonadota bacterium]
MYRSLLFFVSARLRRRGLLAGAGLLLACCARLAQAAPPTDDSLYQAWGGKAGIRAVMDDFVPRLYADARMAPFFKGVDPEHLGAQLTEQLCQEAGGPCRYTGASMKLLHADLNIQRRDFLALVEILQQAMVAQGIPFRAQNRMLARLAPMHRDIISETNEAPAAR